MQKKITHDPIKKKEDVAKNPDHKIDDDFPGFPHGHSAEKVIHPITPTQKKTAALNITDGEKKTYLKKKVSRR